MFEEVVISLGIPENRIDDMMKQDRDKKWRLIEQKKSYVVMDDITAQNCAKFLKNENLQVEDVRELRAVLGTSSISVLEKFSRCDGFTSMRDVGWCNDDSP